jgi:hypothetical protein
MLLCDCYIPRSSDTYPQRQDAAYDKIKENVSIQNLFGSVKYEYHALSNTCIKQRVLCEFQCNEMEHATIEKYCTVLAVLARVTDYAT